MTELEKIAQKYETDLSKLSPEDRDALRAMRARADQRRASGKTAPPSAMLKQDFPIGLDDNYRPFPVRAKTNDQSAPDTDTHNP